MDNSIPNFRKISVAENNQDFILKADNKYTTMTYSSCGRFFINDHCTDLACFIPLGLVIDSLDYKKITALPEEKWLIEFSFDSSLTIVNFFIDNKIAWKGRFDVTREEIYISRQTVQEIIPKIQKYYDELVQAEINSLIFWESF